MENKWELIEHEAHFQITNGPISLCTSEDDADSKIDLMAIVSMLNDLPYDLHSENALELKQHIEIMQLQSELMYEKDRAQILVDALKKIHERAESAIFPHLPIESAGAAMCVDIEKIASAALTNYAGEKEAGNG